MLLPTTKSHANPSVKTCLHTLFRSPYQIDINLMISCIAPYDALLLLQDGVIAALSHVDTVICLLAPDVPVYALREDAEARGLVTKISTSIQLIDYTKFVRLTTQHAVQLAW
ncbi:MAG: sulfurtransferase complex subunit TusB [Candidatus Malihini olakiniferum]